MTDNEKLDLILSEIQGVKSEMQVLNSDMQGVKSEVQALKSDMQGVKSDIQLLKSDIQELKAEMQGVKSDIQALKQRTASIETEIKDIKLTLENEIRVNIQRVAEGHLDLSRNLHEAIQPGNEIEMLAIKVRMLETDVRDLKARLA